MSEENKVKETKDNERTELKEYFNFSEVLTYFFRKKDPTRPTNFNIKAMHTINKISILMFLFAVIFIITRTILRSL